MIALWREKLSLKANRDRRDDAQGDGKPTAFNIIQNQR